MIYTENHFLVSFCLYLKIIYLEANIDNLECHSYTEVIYDGQSRREMRKTYGSNGVSLVFFLKIFCVCLVLNEM